MAGGGRGSRREEAEAADHGGDGWLAAGRRRREVAGRRPRPVGRMEARWPTALRVGEEEERAGLGRRKNERREKGDEEEREREKEK